MNTPIAIIFTFSLLSFTAGYFTGSTNDDSISSIITTSNNCADSGAKQKNHNLLVANKENFNSKKLKDDLKRANKDISRLRSLNENLNRQLKNNNLPIPTSTSYTEIQEKLDTLPLPLIDTQLELLLDDDGLQKIGDSRKFAKRLVDVVLDDFASKPAPKVEITFSTSPLRDVRVLSAPITVNKFDRLFAHLAISEGNTSVFVKWHNLATGEILSLSNQAIGVNGREQYVHARPKEGWSPGQYQVSVHSMDENLSLFGIGRINIAAVNDVPKPEVDPVLQDLIDAGQAFKKTVR